MSGRKWSAWVRVTKNGRIMSVVSPDRVAQPVGKGLRLVRVIITEAK